MQILYKQATKQYIHYDASARRSDLVSDVNEATPRYLHTGQRHLWHLWKIRAA